MDIESWYGRSKRLTLGAHTLCVVDLGASDVPTLLIHGFPTASIDWQPLAPALLEAGLRLIAPDLLGYGYSDKPRLKRYSIFDQADLLQELLRQIGVTSMHILAHDYGDTVAQELLARSERGEAGAIAVRSVCFLNGGLFPETHRPRFIQRLLASPLGPLLARRYTRAKFGAAMRAIFAPGTPPSEADLDAFWALIAHNDGLGIFPKLIGYMAQRRQHRERWVGAMLAARVPIKLINGSLDPVSGAHMVARYRELQPNVDITALADIGHYPQVEAPERVVSAYIAFRNR